ncbi:MAG: Rieske (2Fe-2S) protein [Actinobacteria bacterium]|nr:Rieske (2Fe-2S) protein [Actinomycetota bacterium]
MTPLERPRPGLPGHAPRRHAETLVLALLAGGSAAAIAAIAVYLSGADTQGLGLALGLSFACLAVAAVVASRRLVPQETVVEPLGDHRHEEAVENVEEELGRSSEGLSRRRLLVGAAGGTAGLLGTALVLPVASLGPVLRTGRLHTTPWRRGRRLVDEGGRPVALEELVVGSFLTAFPEGAERRRLDASIVLVRLRPEELELPDERADWDAGGVLAYSKICTHAGCAVSLFRYPSFEPTSERPALVCPCHYSTFDARRGGAVLFGPAGRPLPQLPLDVDSGGMLVARGGFSAAPGPSWWGVRS